MHTDVYQVRPLAWFVFVFTSETNLIVVPVLSVTLLQLLFPPDPSVGTHCLSTETCSALRILILLSDMSAQTNVF